MHLTERLNELVPWQGVLAALGIKPASQSLPLTTRCPLCGKVTLRIYRDVINTDSTQSGTYYCRGCNAAGDMIDLAAAAWGMTPLGALNRLTREGLDLPEACLKPENIAMYVAKYSDARHRMHELWTKGKARFLATAAPEIANLRSRFGLRLDISPERWAAGPGKIFGAVHYLDVMQAVYPKGYRTFTPLSLPVFRGRKWGEVLMCPFYDRPERMSGVGFLGRQGDLLKDRTYLPVGAKEGGLAGLPVLLSSLPSTVIALDNWLLLWQIQARTFRSSLTPGPFVAWHNDERFHTREAWEMLRGRKLIFWINAMTPRALLQAVENNALISMRGPPEPTHEAMQHYLRVTPASDLPRIIERFALPWPTAFRQWLNEQEEGKRMDFLLQLEETSADVSYILKQCGASEHELLKLRPHRGVETTRGYVTEHADEWWVETPRNSQTRHARVAGRRCRILNCTFRITHAIKDKTEGTIYYFGSIRYQGQDIPFLDKAETVQDKTRSWLRDKLADNKLSVVIDHPTYTELLFYIATQMHEPEFVADDLWRWHKKLKEHAMGD